MKRKVSTAYADLTSATEYEMAFNIKRNADKILPIPLPAIKNINTPFEKLTLLAFEQHKEALKR